MSQADAVAIIETKLKKELTKIELDEIENELAEKMKSLCDKNGRETDIHSSALLLHKLGKVYEKRSPDMISLIRSAALYNAALARDPPCKQIVQNDLQHLCSHVLTLASAKKQSAQLINKANTLKQAVLKMRKKVDYRLLEIKSIPEIVENDEELHNLEQIKILSLKDLQDQITDEYKQIMADLACFCEDVLGEAPCRYTLTGLGSLARHEITPYSDFENIILLDNKVKRKKLYEEKVQYFRWFSVIFQIVLINLQETIIPSLAIESLNNWFFDSITLRGISFDGMMPQACKFPLGRQQRTENKPFTTELIKPVDEMLKYLRSDENLKNGYHLSDILTKACFVYKDKEIYDAFKKGVVEASESEKNHESVLQDVKNQVVDDLKSFATRSSLLKLKSNKEFNVKRVVYRSTTLFISALGRICSIRASSCFDVVTELHDKKHISDYARHKLMYAVALACEIRLRWYAKAKRQSDMINTVQELLELIGKRSTLSYFQIAYALQCDISKRLKLKKIHFYSSPTLFNLSLRHSLKDQEHFSKMLRIQKQANASRRLYDFDNCLNILEEQAKEDLTLSKDKATKLLTSVKLFNWKQLQKLGQSLYERECFDDAIEYFELSTESIEHNGLENKHESKVKEEKVNELKMNVSTNFRKTACSLIRLNKLEEAKINLEKSQDILQTLPPDVDIDRKLAITLQNYGWCLTVMNKLEKAKQSLTRSLQILERISFDLDCDFDVCQTLAELGCCLTKLNQLEEAEKCSKRSLQIKKRISLDVETDRSVSVTMLTIAQCMYKMSKFAEAESFFYRSLQIKVRISLDLDSDRGISVTLHELGRCLMKRNRLQKAKSCLERSLQIKEQRSLDLDSDRDISLTVHVLGCCQVKMGEFEIGKIFLERSLSIKEKISVDADSDRGIANSLYELSCCLENMQKFEESQNCLDRSLQIIKRISLGTDSN